MLKVWGQLCFSHMSSLTQRLAEKNLRSSHSISPRSEPDITLREKPRSSKNRRYDGGRAARVGATHGTVVAELLDKLPSVGCGDSWLQGCFLGPFWSRQLGAFQPPSNLWGLLGDEGIDPQIL